MYTCGCVCLLFCLSVCLFLYNSLSFVYISIFVDNYSVACLDAWMLDMHTFMDSCVLTWHRNITLPTYYSGI